MAVSHYILLVVLNTLSILALTVDRPSSLNQKATSDTTLPLTLLQLSSLNASLTRAPPLHWQYDVGYYHLSVYRKPLQTFSKENPGVSLLNWDVAVKKAIKALEDESESAGARPLDPIPEAHFHYETFLSKSAAAHARNPRKLVFDISKRVTSLLFDDVRVILFGLEAYEDEWKTGDGGSLKDQVRMCRFDLYQLDEQDERVLVANGTVGLLIPSSADNGPPVYVSSR